jgi:hypothetical protein
MAKKNKATEVAEVKEEVTEAVETEEVKAEEVIEEEPVKEEPKKETRVI